MGDDDRLIDLIDDKGGQCDDKVHIVLMSSFTGKRLLIDTIENLVPPLLILLLLLLPVVAVVALIPQVQELYMRLYLHFAGREP